MQDKINSGVDEEVFLDTSRFVVKNKFKYSDAINSELTS